MSLLTLIGFTLISTASAAPPSSTLTGPAGALTWTVAASGDGFAIDGRSPKWTVHHVAGADLRPVRTERKDADGNAVTIDYSADHAVVHVGGKDVTVRGADLWDADTVDIRLGRLAAQGHADTTFQAVDGATGTVYGFAATTVGTEMCGSASCVRVHLGMTGFYRLVGPSWEYWYGADGQLLRFEGPIGRFTAPGVP